MRQTVFILETTRQLTGDVWELVLSGDTSAITAPGQFVNIELPGKFLRRPISVCDWDWDSLTLLVKEAGEGTRELVRLPAGTELDVLSGLGNGFDLAQAPAEGAILAGGGIGIAPLYGLARRMLEAGRQIGIVLGFRTKADVFYLEKFKDLRAPLMITTEDGSLGNKGTVATALRAISAAASGDGYILACGPAPMLNAAASVPGVTGQFSFEARMACGFGACVGCTVETKNGLRRVCKDGPVFRKEEILWT